MNNNIQLKIKAAKISVFVGFIMLFAKLSAYFLTGSSAIFSDAAESVIHVMATSLALYSIILSSKPPDKNHLYGHGNVEYFSAGIEGLLIIVAALTIIYFAVSDMITGYIPQQLDWGTAIIGAAGLVNLVLGFYLVKKGKQTNSLALIANGKHILTDSYTSLVVVIGLLIVLLTDIYLIDPIAALVVGLNIIFTGYKLVRQSVGGLMNETDKTQLAKIANTLKNNREENWIDLHNLRFWSAGDKIFIDFHLVLPYFLNIQEAHDIEDRISDSINDSVGSAQTIVHFDFCTKDYCKICDVSDCSVRFEDKSINIPWNEDKMIKDTYVSNPPPEITSL
ncbi:MAG: cation transporter [Ignavibacteriae bacterium]|jgi:cation diffusion facilitator family transporter|nr:cation transporter [Ignavibacteriota bacterium]NOG96522.1 cation transporter [Ignavibacteriota bacterium]